MRFRIRCALACFLLSLITWLTLSSSSFAVDETKSAAPVRMGCGIMTFDTVPGWGLRPDGNSAIGTTHGSIVIDKAGHIYTSAKRGVFVFTPDGKVIKSYESKDFTNIHDMEIRDENGIEFIFFAVFKDGAEVNPEEWLATR